MAATKTKAPWVTGDDVKLYLRLEAERKSLQRRASDLEKRAKKLARQMLAYIRYWGGKKKACIRSGYIMRIDLVDGQISWKQEFIRVAGQTSADRVKPPRRERLSVESAK